MLAIRRYGLGIITFIKNEIVSIYYAYIVRGTFFQNQCSKKNLKRLAVETMSIHVTMA